MPLSIINLTEDLVAFFQTVSRFHVLPPRGVVDYVPASQKTPRDIWHVTVRKKQQNIHK